MTRLTIGVTGDALSFRPVTSSIVRTSKDGAVSVVIMLAGTHYNINMNGILQQDATGDIEPTTQSIGVNNSFLELTAEQFTGGASVAKLIGTFSSFTYFYAGMIIQGHLKLDETSHATPVPELEGHYHFKDLLSNDELFFRLIREETSLKFEAVEIVDTVENVLFSVVLGGGVDEYFFEFRFLQNGKSKLFRVDNYQLSTQTKTRVWIGDIKAAVGECNVAAHLHNIEETLHTVSSDYLFIDYPQVFLKYDRTSTERLIGRIKMFDDLDDADEANWKEIRSRDYKFIGSRIIENGMVRLVIKTVDPLIEIWGWNHQLGLDQWEKVLTVLGDTDAAQKPLQIQNIVFEYFNFAQIKCVINFGTSTYAFIMSRGDPYITMLNTGKLKFKFESDFDRFVGDFKFEHNGYTLENTNESGNPNTLKATGTATCVSCVVGNTLTVNGLVYTGVSGVKADNTEFSIDTGDDETATDIADSLTNDTRVGTDDADIRAKGTAATNVVTITAEAGGTSGNSITMSENSTTITLSGANLTGGATSGGTGLETLTGFTMDDNWFAVYNTGAANQVVGWVSTLALPSQIDIADLVTKFEYILTYPNKGGVFGVGVLPSFPSSLVGDVPFPFTISTQDEYVKWRANEAVLSFREAESIKRR